MKPEDVQHRIAEMTHELNKHISLETIISDYTFRMHPKTIHDLFYLQANSLPGILLNKDSRNSIVKFQGIEVEDHTSLPIGEVFLLPKHVSTKSMSQIYHDCLMIAMGVLKELTTLNAAQKPIKHYQERAFWAVRQIMEIRLNRNIPGDF